MTAPQLPCPTCGRLTPISAASHLPFCSERCRLIDLGRWLNEDNALPVTSSAEAHEAGDSSGQANFGVADYDDWSSRRGSSRYGEDQPRRSVGLPPGWHDA